MDPSDFVGLAGAALSLPQGDAAGSCTRENISSRPDSSRFHHTPAHAWTGGEDITTHLPENRPMRFSPHALARENAKGRRREGRKGGEGEGEGGRGLKGPWETRPNYQRAAPDAGELTFGFDVRQVRRPGA